MLHRNVGMAIRGEALELTGLLHAHPFMTIDSCWGEVELDQEAGRGWGCEGFERGTLLFEKSKWSLLLLLALLCCNEFIGVRDRFDGRSRDDGS